MKYLNAFLAILLVSVSGSIVRANPRLLLSASLIQTGKFKGVIVDGKGKRVRGAAARVENKELKRQLNPNAAGEFKIELPVGIYEITVEKPGFKTHILKEVEITSGADFTYTFRLESSRILQPGSQTAHLDGKTSGFISDLSCKPMVNARIVLKRKEWLQLVMPDYRGHFIVDVPAGDYLITVSLPNPAKTKDQAFIVRRDKRGDIYFLVDTGGECMHCRCIEDEDEDLLIPVEPIIINNNIEERKTPSQP